MSQGPSVYIRSKCDYKCIELLVLFQYDIERVLVSQILSGIDINKNA